MCGASGGVAGQPQRDVGLDRRGQVGRAAVEGRPGAVVALLGADPARRLARSPARCGCRGTRAAAGPRRPSSRWSRARPSTSRPGACSPSRSGARASESERRAGRAAVSTRDRTSSGQRSRRIAITSATAGQLEPARRRRSAGMRRRSWASARGASVVGRPRSAAQRRPPACSTQPAAASTSVGSRSVSSALGRAGQPRSRSTAGRAAASAATTGSDFLRARRSDEHRLAGHRRVAPDRRAGRRRAGRPGPSRSPNVGEAGPPAARRARPGPRRCAQAHASSGAGLAGRHLAGTRRASRRRASRSPGRRPARRSARWTAALSSRAARRAGVPASSSTSAASASSASPARIAGRHARRRSRRSAGAGAPVAVHDVVVQQREVVHELDRDRAGQPAVGRRARGPAPTAAPAPAAAPCRRRRPAGAAVGVDPAEVVRGDQAQSRVEPVDAPAQRRTEPRHRARGHGSSSRRTGPTSAERRHSPTRGRRIWRGKAGGRRRSVPLRTAPSIVAGHPVSVHAPARASPAGRVRPAAVARRCPASAGKSRSARG